MCTKTLSDRRRKKHINCVRILNLQTSLNFCGHIRTKSRLFLGLFFTDVLKKHVCFFLILTRCTLLQGVQPDPAKERVAGPPRQAQGGDPGTVAACNQPWLETLIYL